MKTTCSFEHGKLLWFFGVKGSPTEKDAGSIQALPKWGGGSRPLPKWFGALILRRIVHVQRAFAWFGGSEPLPGWFGALMQ